MKNTQNITLMLLIVTTAVLTTLLVASWLHTEPAYAGASAKDGDYIMAIGSYNEESDFLYVLDIANAKLNIYYADINTNSIRPGGTVDLARAFGAVAPPKR